MRGGQGVLQKANISVFFTPANQPANRPLARYTPLENFNPDPPLWEFFEKNRGIDRSRRARSESDEFFKIPIEGGSGWFTKVAPHLIGHLRKK